MMKCFLHACIDHQAKRPTNLMISVIDLVYFLTM